jgi:signal transduction histidine kinase
LHSNPKESMGYTTMRMGLFDAGSIRVFLSVLETLLYVPIIVSAFRRRQEQDTAALLVASYAAVALVLAALETAFLLAAPAVTAGLYLQASLLGTLVLAILLIPLVRTFLRVSGGLGWYLAAIAWPVLAILLAEDAFRLPEVIWQTSERVLLRSHLPLLMVVAGWVVSVGASVVLLFDAYRRSRQPLYRNRISYWAVIFALVVAKDLIFLAADPLWGVAPRLAATALILYVMLTHHVSDVRDVLRRSTIYVATTLFVALVFAVGLFIAQAALPPLRGVNPLVVYGGIALLLALTFTLLLGPVRRAADRIFPTEAYNASQALREYSANVSNILEMERLASIAMGLIMDTLGISRGFLFLVDLEIGQEGQSAYRLRGVRPEGERSAPEGNFNEQSPVALDLVKRQSPLLQYDIDLLPAFRRTPAAERAWLATLDTEVYVPIFAKREWIGMFAFGSKLSRRRYTEEDLVVLSTLANQTAVALENARLVENLVRLNTQIRQAYAELDRANRNLEKIDRAKTDFVSIASHELRTPLTVMRGYAGMLLDAPVIREQEALLKWVTGINESSLRMHEIMESMFDMVQLDNRTMQIHMQTVDLAELIGLVALNLASSATERKQTLAVELPPLPTIYADPNLLQKVFIHLIRNAIKFTPDGGQIRVNGHEILQAAHDLPEGGVEVSVSDSGVGVAPENAEVIFTKFYQAGDLNRHSSGKVKFRGAGAGLGLALSRGIVEAHNGRIWVESSGHDEQSCPGSQFHVLLPLRPHSATTPLPPQRDGEA